MSLTAIIIERDGSVVAETRPEDEWMDEDIVWAETEYRGHPDHAIYYDDEAMEDPGMVRAVIAGVEVPLPVWIVGVDGENTCPPTVSIEKVKGDLSLAA